MMELLLTGLLLMFIGLKLGNVIDWSWWWVLAPFWIPVLIAVLAWLAFLVSRAFETPQEKAVRLLKEYADALSKRQ